MESRFKNIDSRLTRLSEKLGATLTKDRPSYPEALRTFEERRIDWIKDDILLAIIIQPTFERDGVNQGKWNFLTIAWKDDGTSIHRPQRIDRMVVEEEFSVIESRIDDLLEHAQETLLNISDSDLS